MKLYCGIDWAEAHHDVAIIDDAGRVVSSNRIGNDVAGFAQLLTMLAESGDTPANPVPVAIETDRGLLVGALRATGRVTYPINPLTASPYRSRHQVSGAEADASATVLLANIVRTDAAAHRPLSTDAELAQAVRWLARAQQDAVWARQQLGNQVRSLIKDFYSAALEASAALGRGGLARDARTVLAAAPTPDRSTKPTRPQLRGLQGKSGRQRSIDTDVDRLRTVFRANYLHQLVMAENAMGIQLASLLRQFDAACTAAEKSAEAARAHCEGHPDATTTSFPGLGSLAGARLGETGDDRKRFTDARGLKAFAGSATTTRASGKKTVVLHRQIKNRCLAVVGSIWSMWSLRASPGARHHFDARRVARDWNQHAQRRPFNKFLGQLHHCLQPGCLYDEHRAFHLHTRGLTLNSVKCLVLKLLPPG